MYNSPNMRNTWIFVSLLFIASVGIIFVIGGKNFLKEQPLKELEDMVYERINALEGYLGFAFFDQRTGLSLEVNGNVTFHAASLMKVPVMIEVFRQAQEGKFSLDQSVKVKNSFTSIVDGSEFSLTEYNGPLIDSIGKSATIRRLTEVMITHSDNLATNILVELTGAENIMKTINDLGTKNTTILRGVEDIKAYDLGKNNRTTPVDMMILMKAIADGRAVSPSASEEMKNIMLDQEFRSKIPALLPKEVKVAHKTGHISEHQHDAAIVYTPYGNYILVIMTKGLIKDEEGVEAIAQLSRIVYDYYSSGKLRESLVK